MRFKVISLAIATSAYFIPRCATDGGFELPSFAAESYFDREIYRYEDRDYYDDHYREVSEDTEDSN